MYLGVASLTDGHLEVMVHRRLLEDDERGVLEPLNEREADGTGLKVKGRFRLLLEEPSRAMRAVRRGMEEMYMAPMVAFSPAEGLSVADTPVFEALPSFVGLQTLEQISESEMLVRVSHLFAVGEDAELSPQVEVDLKNLMPPQYKRLVCVFTEMNLAGTSPLSEQPEPLRWKVKGEGEGEDSGPSEEKRSDPLQNRNVHDEEKNRPI
jgi:hypothetical protein